MCVCVLHVEAKRLLAAISSLLLQNSGHQAWWQTSLTTEPSLWSHIIFKTEPGTHSSGRVGWPAISRDPPLSASPAVGLQAQVTLPSLYMVAGDPN